MTVVVFEEILETLSSDSSSLLVSGIGAHLQSVSVHFHFRLDVGKLDIISEALDNHGQ